MSNATEEDERQIVSLSEIKSMDAYLKAFGNLLIAKAINSMNPLHMPERDTLPDFDEYIREPFEPQKHMIAAAVKLLDERGCGFMIGEMGTGKTILSIVTADLHAKRSRAAGGSDGKYRAAVLCPDHLLDKWKREILDTVPGATVRTFKKWHDFLDLVDDYGDAAPGSHGGRTKRWKKPRGPEWFLLGRNQIKWEPGWTGIGEETRRTFNNKPSVGKPRRFVGPEYEYVFDENGLTVFDENGRAKRRAVFTAMPSCPRCGQTPTVTNGKPVGFDSIARGQVTCNSIMLDEIREAESTLSGRDQLTPGKLRDHHQKLAPNRDVRYGGKNWRCRACDERLWQWAATKRTGRRWAAAKIVQKKLRRFFDYLIVDEVHEQKSDESAQSMAMGKVLAASRYCLALTGTFIGGYADHLFPLLMRMAPDEMIPRGFEWGKSKDFSKVYGKIDRVVSSSVPAEVITGKGRTSMRRTRNTTGKSKEDRYVKPGIMPTLFGQIVLPLAMFIRLDEMADELPELTEYVGPPPEPVTNEDGTVETDPFGLETACPLPPDIMAEYKRVEMKLGLAMREMLGRGSMKLLSVTNHTLLAYPDMPRMWERQFPDHHAVGYWDIPKVLTENNWRGVVSPFNFPEERVLPKEMRLVEIAKLCQEAGEQLWVYCQMTQKRNVMPRLKKILESHDLKVGILRTGDVNPREREQWIIDHGKKFDVMLSHPKLVSTGLDLFSKDVGGHNYNNICFYQTGYNLFDLEQASRRAWRIAQPKDCRVWYMSAKGTAQEIAMLLMSRKAAARRHLQGEVKFGENSLAALSGDTSMAMELVRSISEKIDPSEVHRNWGKVKSGANRAKRPKHRPMPRILSLPGSMFDEANVPRPGDDYDFDHLSLGEAVAAETIFRAQESLLNDELDEFGMNPNDIDDFLDGIANDLGDEPVIEFHRPVEPVRKSKVPRLSRKDIEDMLSGADGGGSDSDWDW